MKMKVKYVVKVDMTQIYHTPDNTAPQLTKKDYSEVKKPSPSSFFRGKLYNWDNKKGLTTINDQTKNERKGEMTHEED